MASNAILLMIPLALINFMRISVAFDASPLQDFCVARCHRPTGTLPCKNPATVSANDFFLSGLHLPGNTTNPYGAAVKAVNATTLPGLNSLGLALIRVDLATGGFFPPHFHPRATELVAVLEGAVEVGFITSYPHYKYFSKIVRTGDVFVVPVGLLHNMRNVNRGNSVAIVAFNSQNRGIIDIPNGIFGANPAVDSGYLAGAFQLDQKTVQYLQRKF